MRAGRNAADTGFSERKQRRPGRPALQRNHEYAMNLIHAVGVLRKERMIALRRAAKQGFVLT
jgi:hypothetical protein